MVMHTTVTHVGSPWDASAEIGDLHKTSRKDSQKVEGSQGVSVLLEVVFSLLFNMLHQDSVFETLKVLLF